MMAMMDKNLVKLYRELIHKYRENDFIASIDIGYRVIPGGFDKDECCIAINLNGEDQDFVQSEDRRNPRIQIRSTQVCNHISRRGVKPVRNNRTKRLKKIAPGVSIGFGDTGTLGIFCYDNLNNLRPSLLTCFHVIKSLKKGVPVVQPGIIKDGGTIQQDTIAQYVRRDPHGDSAIARLIGRRAKTDEIFEMGFSIKSFAAAKVGDVLHKSGRTTGVTHAEVSARSLYFRNINKRRVGIPGFKLIPTDGGPREISMPGDSGAIWINQTTMKACGLHFGGEKPSNPNVEFALAQDISHVLKRLNVSLTKPRR
jgi:endonuclease G